jgi:hypothetical protein
LGLIALLTLKKPSGSSMPFFFKVAASHLQPQPAGLWDSSRHFGILDTQQPQIPFKFHHPDRIGIADNFVVKRCSTRAARSDLPSLVKTFSARQSDQRSNRTDSDPPFYRIAEFP